jgi:hypothetical protein
MTPDLFRKLGVRTMGQAVIHATNHLMLFGSR